MPTAGARSRATAVFHLCLLNVTVFAAAISGSRRGTKDVVDILLRNSGHPRSKPMELPLLGHRARSCRSRPRAPPLRAHDCSPGLIHATRPRRRRPAPPSHRRRRPLSASLPTRPVRRPAARVRDRRPLPSASPYAAHVTCRAFQVQSRVRSTRNAARSRSHAPMRHSDGRPSPARLQASSAVADGRAVSGALTLTEPYRGVPAPERRSNRPMRCHASPASTPRILAVTHRGRDALSRHYSSSSTATLPHAGALRHEPIMRRTAPEHRATHGVAAPVTNFRLREISDRGRPHSRPPAPAAAP